MFEDWGQYIGPVDGHDLVELETAYAGLRFRVRSSCTPSRRRGGATLLPRPMKRIGSTV